MKVTKVLIVEDSKVTAKTIKKSLIDLKYEVVDICAAGEEAIRSALIYNPDIILMDIQLEGEMNGLETATKITNILNIPVIYLTALSDKQMLEQAKLSEGYSFLVKPFEEAELYFNIEMTLYKHEMKNKLQEERKWLNTILQSIEDGVIATDKDGNIKFMNESAMALTGYSGGELNVKLKDIISLLDCKTKEKIDVMNLHVKEEKILLGANNKEYITICQLTEIPKTNKEKMGYVLTFSDVSEETKLRNDINYLTFHDQLTGVYNRTYFEKEFSKFDVQEYMPVSIIITDLNGLKLTNDVFGHKAGDDLIKNAAKAITESCREGDLVARLGGDEFIIALPNTDRGTAEEVAKKIHKLCNIQETVLDKVSMAIGIATKEKMRQDMSSVVSEADDDMYSKKFIESKRIREEILEYLKNKLRQNPHNKEQKLIEMGRILIEMGKKMNFSQKQLEELMLYKEAGDIGMLTIPEEILHKGSKLDRKEWDIVKKHPEIGYRISMAIKKFIPIAEYILYHHERWDGKGYPHKLKGEEIPLISRMIAIVEAYDSMTTDREYRKAMNKEEAILEITRCAGTQFDPKLIEVFKEVI
ncbi:diguanylate cyclase [Clostridium ganghwense]|uniref:Stage 0 sporulation protein A homolog n=1 Tax=Clostridium ganghwense TaxID=312089 RepID=A0ABT4CNA1_9CLOT|nr:HD domain-containing phosphohydrolase [Clostridium ganghwense]MCY6369913.1 diguanylate cyclase [Clostridium ganghwense]